VGFLWGSAAVSLSCGVSVGLAEALNWPDRPGTGYPSPAGFRILMITSRLTQCHRSDLPAYGNSAPNADSALTWLRCGRTFPATQKCRFGVGRSDSARLAAIMLLIDGWRRGPGRVSGHVQETLAARGNLAVACEAAGDRAIPLMPG
jgi:hypothetical protein